MENPRRDGGAMHLRGLRLPQVRWPSAQKMVERAPHRDPATCCLLEEDVAAIQERIQKLERVLDVFGRGFRARVPGAPEVFDEGLSSGTQLEQFLKFVRQSQKRLQVFDEERTKEKEARLLEEAKQRVARLRLAAREPPH